MDDVVKPHLELEIKHIKEKTSRFVDDLTEFLKQEEEANARPVRFNQEIAAWLHISTLRMMAQFLKQNYEQTDGLLEILENRAGKKLRGN